MRSIFHRRARLLGISLAAGLAALVGFGAACRAGDRPAAPPICPKCQRPAPGPHPHNGPGYGTLGYGKPGLYPGFQGFGLGYHVGYGYGGEALGVGAEGGFPFYGGPGYPHPWPTLRRIGGINPFPYYGGPGFPTPDRPNYFGPVGPLAPDVPVVKVESEPGAPVGNYGCFDGIIPYPETMFAPFTTIAAGGGSSSGVSSDSAPDAPPNMAPAPGEMPHGAAPTRLLGIDVEPVVDAGGVRGLKLAKVYPGGEGEKAGLRDGDVIRSINGYVMEQPGNLAWVIARSTENVIKMSVRTAIDGQVHTITIRRP